MAQVGLLEDNTRIAKLCATMLQYAGHQVVIYEHPRACLAALVPQDAHQEHSSVTDLPVDVLILDLNLPDIPGMEVVRCLRAYPGTHELPLIFCTAATPSEVARAMRIAPQANFVEKPFTYQELMLAISLALSSQGK